MKTLDEIQLADLMPESIASDENVASAAESIDWQLQTITNHLDVPSIYLAIDKLTSVQLDHLAVGWNAATWRDYWPIAMKRSMIKNVILSNRRRGTVQAVKEALASASSAATLVEWWETEPKGTPHTFTVYATQSKVSGVIDSELQKDILALVNDAKPLRSHFEFVVQEELHSQIQAFGVIRQGVVTRLRRKGSDVS